MASIKCPRCGAPVDYDVADKLVRCTYCSSEIYLDRSGAGFYYILPFTIDQNGAVGMFKRWAGGSTRAKDLDRLARITSMKKLYFPVYQFKRDLEGKEQVFVEPAASTILPGLHSLKVPGGDMKVYDQKFDVGGVEMVKPDIEMTHYLSQMPGTAKEQALVYFPIYVLDYDFQGKNYQAVISATSGEVFSDLAPGRSSGAYLLIAIIGFIAFLAEGLLALASPGLAVILMGLTVVGIFFSSYFVAKRL